MGLLCGIVVRLILFISFLKSCVAQVLTPIPSSSPTPAIIITFSPTYVPLSFVDVSSENELNSAIMDRSTITFTSSISLALNTTVISGIRSLVVDGRGETLSGANIMRCMLIKDFSSVEITNLKISNCNTVRYYSFPMNLQTFGHIIIIYLFTPSLFFIKYNNLHYICIYRNIADRVCI